VHELGIDIAAEVGGAERVLGAGRHVGGDLAGRQEQDLGRVGGRELVGEHSDQQEQQVDHDAGEGERVAQRHGEQPPHRGWQPPADPYR
jgi:hypothetical protein